MSTVQPPNRRNLHHFDEALPAGCYVEKLRATGERCCSADKMIFKVNEKLSPIIPPNVKDENKVVDKSSFFSAVPCLSGLH